MLYTNKKQKQKEKKNSVKLIKFEKANILSCTLKEIDTKSEGKS